MLNTTPMPTPTIMESVTEFSVADINVDDVAELQKYYEWLTSDSECAYSEFKGDENGL